VHCLSLILVFEMASSSRKGSAVSKVPELVPVVDETKKLAGEIAGLKLTLEAEIGAHNVTRDALAKLKVDARSCLAKLNDARAERDAAIAERDTASRRIEELEKAAASSKPTSPPPPPPAAAASSKPTPPPPPPPAAPKPAPAASEITNVVPAADFASPSLSMHQRVALMHANLIAQRASTQVAQPGPKPPSAQVNVVSKLLAADKSKPLAPAPKDTTLAGPDFVQTILRRLEKLDEAYREQQENVKGLKKDNLALWKALNDSTADLQNLGVGVERSKTFISDLIETHTERLDKLESRVSGAEDSDGSEAGSKAAGGAAVEVAGGSLPTGTSEAAGEAAGGAAGGAAGEAAGEAAAVVSASPVPAAGITVATTGTA
jgi:peptidoglycan hydrolase CwlO-like protein